VAIVSSTNASPIQITVGATTGLANGNQVVIEGHTVNTNANGAWTIAGVTGTTFTLTGSTGNGVGGATGTVFKPGKTAPLGGSQIGTGAQRLHDGHHEQAGSADGLVGCGSEQRAASRSSGSSARPRRPSRPTSPSRPISVQDKEIRGGVFVRYKDTNNWLLAVRRHRYFADTHFLLGQSMAWTYFSLYKRVAGVVTPLGDYVLRLRSSSSRTAVWTRRMTRGLSRSESQLTRRGASRSTRRHRAPISARQSSPLPRTPI
jgi:hypothetical protein